MDPAFEQVEVGTLEPSPASPDVDPDAFTGVKIAMPDRLTFGELGRVPLCGTWVFSDAVLPRWPHLPDCLVFLAVDVQTHRSKSGNFRYHDYEATKDELGPEPDEPPPPPEEALKATGWFNMDLARVWKIPAVPARYRLRVTLDEHQSNTVEFEVVP